MANEKTLSALSKEELIELIGIYSKDWLAMDGVWFQSVERECGMAAAMRHDAEAWRRFTVIEAEKTRRFLKLPERPGLEGLRRALELRLYANINPCEIAIEGGALIYRVVECRVQSARLRKGMPLHPCKPVGLIEYAGFAKAIDPRISCECLSCCPDITDDSCACLWRFTIADASATPAPAQS